MTDDADPPSSTPPADPSARAAATEWSVPDCPQCGRPVWVVTVSGPSTATAGPCGCTVPPALLERESD